MSFKCSHYLLLGIISLYKSLTDVRPWCVYGCVCVLLVVRRMHSEEMPRSSTCKKEAGMFVIGGARRSVYVK